MRKIGYLGPPGTFSELAVQRYLALQKDAQLVPVCLPAIDDILAGVAGGELAAGVVPLENSTAGAVTRTQDLLARRFPALYIAGELVLPVEHHLLARPGVALAEVRRVLSHPQALAQCREYIRRMLPGVREVATASTAEAARLVAASGRPWAAVGTPAAARACGLAVLAEKINDCTGNVTRFVVVGTRDGRPGAGCKTSLILSLDDRPGALHDALGEFARRRINLTRIESRPSGRRLGEYLFFIDLVGHRLDPPVKEALAALADKCAGLRLLGSYCPVDGEGKEVQARGKTAPAFAGGSESAAAREGGGEYTGWTEAADRPPLPAAPPEFAAREAGLAEIRRQIDAVDEQLVALLARRMQLVRRVGRCKPAGCVRDPAREEEVLRRVRRRARQAGADPEMVARVFRLLIEQAVEMQQPHGRGH